MISLRRPSMMRDRRSEVTLAASEIVSMKKKKEKEREKKIENRREESIEDWSAIGAQSREALSPN